MRKYDIKRMPWVGIALCAFILILLPNIVSFRHLDAKSIGMIGECATPVMGMLLFIPPAFCEDQTGRREVLTCRPEPYWRGFAARLSFSMALAALFIAAFVVFTCSQSLPFDGMSMGAGLYTTMLLFRCVGLTLGHDTRNQPLSYLIPFACFWIEFFTRGRFTGCFFLLSMMDGVLHVEKLILLGGAFLILMVNVPLSMRQVSVGAEIG